MAPRRGKGTATTALLPDGTLVTRLLASRQVLWHPVRMTEANLLSQLHDRLTEHMRVVEDVLEEIRVDLQWGVRNGRVRIVSMAADPCADDMRLNEATGATVCALCDAETDSLAEAMRQGWTQFQRDKPGTFLGVCPGCAESKVADEREPGRLF